MAQKSNKEGPFVIGVDAGTESLRAGVFDLEGNPLAFSSTAYQTTFPKPGWAEQNPQDWWEALGKSVINSITVLNKEPAHIKGLFFILSSISLKPVS